MNLLLKFDYINGINHVLLKLKLFFLPQMEVICGFIRLDLEIYNSMIIEIN